MDPAIYPVNDFGPLMKGLAIGGLGIFHVFNAHFAIGGGMLLTFFQWLAMTGRQPWLDPRRVDRHDPVPQLGGRGVGGGRRWSAGTRWSVCSASGCT